MPRSVHFASQAWEDYQYWLAQDKKILKRINRLIEDARRNPSDGIGDTKRLSGPLSEFWSRRITKEHRMVYQFTDDKLILAQLRYHY